MALVLHAAYLPMYIAVLWQLVLGGLLVSVAAATPKRSRRQSGASNVPSQFVTTQNGKFVVNGSALKVVGTNAYWLHALNTDEDIDNTLASIAAVGIKVVRTWAFNDVNVIPQNGTWFQLVANGTTSVNTGPNGLQKLDTVVRLAEKHGILLHMALTNNWNPLPLVDGPDGFTRRDVTKGTNNKFPRNTLSNDYGGMDVYIREFNAPRKHDQFYVNETLINAFKNYTTQIVSRYVNSPAIFAWEIANDPRCNSTLPAASTCTTTTVTNWHSTIAQHVKSVDPNHLVSSGNQGFFCVDCPKLFPSTPTPPTPQVSSAPGTRRRGLPRFLTKARLLQDRTEALKKTRNLQKRSSPPAGGVKVRGRWVATPTRRQDDVGVGSAFDGSQGVDSEDILNIPEIGFGSFQLFPDQVSYGPVDPNLPAFNNTVQTGIDWIKRHAEAGLAAGKPVSLVGFGLVTQANLPFFVPFNTTVGPDQSTSSLSTRQDQQAIGVSDGQRDDAYSQWLNAGLLAGLSSMVQYQWSQGDLTEQDGTVVSSSQTETGVSSTVTGTGVSPNDGYGINGVGQVDAQDTISEASQAFGSDS